MRKFKKGKQVMAVLLMFVMIVTSATACGSKKSVEKEQLVFRMAIVDGESSPIYKGAKAMLLVNEVDDKEFLIDLFRAMYDELPMPKVKKERNL